MTLADIQSNPYLLGTAAFLCVLTENLLRGIQNKNVAAGYRKAIFFTGATMTLCDGLTMVILATGGLNMLPYTVTGSALGWTLGPLIHDRLTRSYREELRLARKQKKRQKWQAREQELIAKLEHHRAQADH
jgi:hypothetical protein